MKKFKKLLAGFMTLAMLVTMLPATVLADDSPKTTTVVITNDAKKNGDAFFKAVKEANF